MLKVVETEEAADLPADITGFKLRQPRPSELLLRLPVTQCTRFPVDLAYMRDTTRPSSTTC